jgi:hypothetical protein
MKLNKNSYAHILGLLGLFLFLQCSSGQVSHGNFDTAYLKKYDGGDSLMLTVMGGKSLMVHDINSLFKPTQYYVDSGIFIVPRRMGFILPNEITTVPEGDYPFVKGGIRIGGDSVKIDLYFDDYDDKKIMASTWNGAYKIQWK